MLFRTLTLSLCCDHIIHSLQLPHKWILKICYSRHNRGTVAVCASILVLRDNAEAALHCVLQHRIDHLLLLLVFLLPPLPLLFLRRRHHGTRGHVYGLRLAQGKQQLR